LAAAAVDEQIAGHEVPDGGPEEPPAAVPLPELKRRADFMYSGATGAAVASGAEGVTTAPTYGLVQDVISVVKALPSALFDPQAEHRPCGLLDKYDAMGMLICDVIGLPLPPWTLAKPVGKAAAKLKEKIGGEQSKEKKRAGRAGQDPAEAAAAVLRRRVALELPAAADIAAAWKQLHKEAAQPPAPAPAAAPEPSAPEPAPMPAPTPTPLHPNSRPRPLPLPRPLPSSACSARVRQRGRSSRPATSSSTGRSLRKS
jgi:hypothetical protein